VPTTNGQLTAITLGDGPQAWRDAGFDVGPGDVLVLGSTAVHLSGSGAGFEGWSLAGVDAPIDGLPVTPVPDQTNPTGSPHPNGISRIDHIVVRTGNSERTVAAFSAAGFEVRGGRSTTSYGAPMRQTFLWAGDVILELVGPDDGEPTTEEPTSIFGLALVSDDLDETATRLGELLGAPKAAVQPGRRIAGLRHRQVGMSLPVAVMSPHVRSGEAPSDRPVEP
jgi:hypothetical protein